MPSVYDLERFATKNALNALRDDVNDFRRQMLALHAQMIERAAGSQITP